MNIIGILLLATLVEGFTEYAFPMLSESKKYIAMFLGVLVAVAYNVDIPAQFTDLISSFPYFGNVVSGIVIGRGSNYLNDIVTRLRGEQKGE